jgi:hypothetical protein
VTLPTIRSNITEFLRFSDEVQPKIPQGHLPMRVLVMGGRDPYKNDLVKWMWGLEPETPVVCVCVCVCVCSCIYLYVCMCVLKK